MDSTTSPRPASLQHAEAREGDLDDRIRQAELRLIGREEKLQRGVAALGVRCARRCSRAACSCRSRARRWRSARLWWLWRRRGRAPNAAAPRSEAPAVSHGGGPWMGLLGLLVPLLPAPWRHRLNPATVSTVMAIAGTLFGKAQQHTPAAPLPTAAPVAPRQLAGAWHEVAHLGPHRHAGLQGAVPMLRFTARGDGRISLSSGDGSPPGLAEPVPGSGGAKLRTTHWPTALHWLPMALA